MDDRIVSISRNVTLIGAGQVNKALLSEALALAPLLVAADGGTQIALKYGKTPEYVIGDLDSADPGALARVASDRVIHVAEQETTDFDKALRHVRAPLVIGVGFLGRRLDHALAALSTLVRRADRRCILLGAHDVCFHLPADIELNLPAGMRLSLFPLREVGGRSRGLQWPIDGLRLAPDGLIGTSNRVTAGPVRLSMDGPGLVAMLPRKALPEVARALGAASG